jgi:hypothetical protein
MTRLFLVAVAVGTLSGLLRAVARARRNRAGAGAAKAEETAPTRTPGPLARGIAGCLMYVLGPLRVLRTHQIMPSQAAIPVTPTDFDSWPARARSYVTRTEGILALLGFGAGVHARMTSTTNVSTFVSLLEHQDHSTLASVSVVQREEGPVTKIIFFRSELADGTVVITTNGRVKRRFPRRPGQVALSFPELSRASALLAVHRFRVREHSGGRPPRTITRAPDPVAYQRREALETFDHFRRIGYYRQESNETLRLTPKGALCTVWRGKFPWAQFTDWRDAHSRNVVLTRYLAAKGSRGDTAAA